MGGLGVAPRSPGAVQGGRVVTTWEDPPVRSSATTRAGVLRHRRADYELIRLAAPRWGLSLNEARRQMLAPGAACWLEAD